VQQYPKIPRSFIDDLAIRHGPPEILGPVLLKAESLARYKGLVVSVTTLRDLAEVNARQRSSWFPLFPTFNPDYSAVPDDQAFALIGTNGRGEVVATHACRLFDWSKRSFADALRSQTLLYDSPERHVGEGQTADVTAPSAERLVGNVVFSGAVWYRPDYRGRELAPLMGQISKGIALARWGMDYMTAIMEERVARSDLQTRAGYRHFEWEVRFENFPLGQRYGLAWSSFGDIIDWSRVNLNSYALDIAVGARQGRA